MQATLSSMDQKMTKTTENPEDAVTTLRIRYRCRPTYNKGNLAAMTVLGQAGLDRSIYLAMAMDQLSKTSRPRGRMSAMLEKYRVQAPSAQHLGFSPPLREPGVFTDKVGVITEDLVAHGLVVEGQFGDDEVKAAVGAVPSYRLPGLGGRILIWTPHVREQFMRMRGQSSPPGEAQEEFEREYLRVQMRRFSGDISRAASFIGMERSALQRKLRALGIGQQAKDQA